MTFHNINFIVTPGRGCSRESAPCCSFLWQIKRGIEPGSIQTVATRISPQPPTDRMMKRDRIFPNGHRAAGRLGRLGSAHSRRIALWSWLFATGEVGGEFKTESKSGPRLEPVGPRLPEAGSCLRSVRAFSGSGKRGGAQNAVEALRHPPITGPAIRQRLSSCRGAGRRRSSWRGQAGHRRRLRLPRPLRGSRQVP